MNTIAGTVEEGMQVTLFGVKGTVERVSIDNIPNYNVWVRLDENPEDRIKWAIANKIGHIYTTPNVDGDHIDDVDDRWYGDWTGLYVIAAGRGSGTHKPAPFDRNPGIKIVG